GLAIPLPAMSGADPWIGSNIDGGCRSGLMLAPGAIPRLPEIAAPRSVRMSPKRFDPTITAEGVGGGAIRAPSASPVDCRKLTDGYERLTSAATSSHNTIP